MYTCVGRPNRRRSKTIRHDFELRGRGGEADVMILPSRTGVYFVNTRVDPSYGDYTIVSHTIISEETKPLLC